jgi:PAS domain S-box-containing protein
MQLFGEHLDRQKTAVSILLGIAGFAGAFYSFNIPLPPHRISITWSLFLPMLAALAYGWRSAVVVVTLGGMGFFSFFLLPTQGWANLVNAVIYSSWYIVHGYAADLRRTRPSFWNNPYSVQVLCSAAYTLMLVTVFPRLFTFNPPLWYPSATTFIPSAVVQGIAVKLALLMFFSLFLCDLLLNLPAVLRLLGLPVPSSARFTPRVTVISLVISFVIIIAFQVLETALTQKDMDRAIEQAVAAEHMRMAILVMLLSMVTGLYLAKYMGKRHDAEEALRVSQERFSAIFDSVNDAIFLQDAVSGSILDVNRHMSELFGYSREEVRALSVGDISSGEPPYTATDALAWLHRSAGGPQVFEWRFRRKDGRLFWGEVNMRRAVIGGDDRMLMVVRDITRRKKVETELQESERRFRMLFDSAGDAIFLMEGERIVDCNNKTLEMFGSSWEHILGSTPVRFSPQIQPDGRTSQEKAREKIEAALAGESQFFEWRHARYDGSVFDAEVNLTMISLPSGRLIQAIVREVTERKRSEEEREKLITDIRKALAAVSRSQKEWQDTFDNITDMISIHDTDYNVIRANKAFAAHLGMHPRDVINRKCYELIHHGASSPIAACPHKRTMQDRKPVSEEIHDEQSNKTLYVTTYPYLSPDGEIIGSIHIARDITDEKEREMRMIMTERLASLGQMASGIAHEINNPLESVMICAEMLLMRVAKDKYDHAQFEKCLKIIDEEVLRCRDITSNMLSFSRQTTLNKSDIDVHFLLDKAVDLVGFQGRLKNVTVSKKYGAKFMVSGNEGELRQVFLVLLINALDAMKNKGAITVETGADAGSAWVKISDTGPGIAPENLQKIFHPFFSTKIEQGGTGLGLSIAHRIIANHRGSLTVVSEQGRGATFTITLPR